VEMSQKPSDKKIRSSSSTSYTYSDSQYEDYVYIPFDSIMNSITGNQQVMINNEKHPVYTIGRNIVYTCDEHATSLKDVQKFQKTCSFGIMSAKQYLDAIDNYWITYNNITKAKKTQQNVTQVDKLDHSKFWHVEADYLCWVPPQYVDMNVVYQFAQSQSKFQPQSQFQPKSQSQRPQLQPQSQSQSQSKLELQVPCEKSAQFANFGNDYDSTKVASDTLKKHLEQYVDEKKKQK